MNKVGVETVRKMRTKLKCCMLTRDTLKWETCLPSVTGGWRNFVAEIAKQGSSGLSWWSPRFPLLLAEIDKTEASLCIWRTFSSGKLLVLLLDLLNVKWSWHMKSTVYVQLSRPTSAAWWTAMQQGSVHPSRLFYGWNPSRSVIVVFSICNNNNTQMINLLATFSCIYYYSGPG